MIGNHTGFVTGRFGVFIEPTWYLSELYYTVSIFDYQLNEYVISDTVDDYTEAIKQTKIYLKEIMNL